ncbi:nucleotidyltransferase family protein [Candidatus Woesearchaeota archaeon]|nr:nucleotidyltransferase family protein [Candidatus Woesearchaeota archaeon]
MKAVIIAGGLGTRLRPVTYEMPKHLIPVQGKPFLEYTIETLKKGGVDEIYISIGYLADKLKAHLGDGGKFGVKIHYLIEDKPLGTGGWMNLVGRNDFKGDFVVLNGDDLCDIDIASFVAFHKKNKGLMTIALKEIDNVKGFGVIELEGDKISRFLYGQDAENAASKCVSIGYYVFNEKIFDFLPDKEVVSLENDLQKVLAEKGLLYGFKTDAQWFGIGTFEIWERAIKEWRKK